ncbi:hypothetical protein RchiOBHm_Chr1g0365231 [Rosa chinensis]|uniref:Uncharacterized protein n=1 Tax=Rosa chinensis TaxID=74649 RepID=A0A2P6SJY6_ROSCH|nr:hypothetical protein RchiOBHm_Chr1g0365231 [Rosa chinensis]
MQLVTIAFITRGMDQIGMKKHRRCQNRRSPLRSSNPNFNPWLNTIGN